MCVVSLVVYCKPFTKVVSAPAPEFGANSRVFGDPALTNNPPLKLTGSRQPIATHRYNELTCVVSFVVYCKPFTKEKPSIDSNASL